MFLENLKIFQLITWAWGVNLLFKLSLHCLWMIPCVNCLSKISQKKSWHYCCILCRVFCIKFVTRYRMPKVSVRPPHMEQRRMYFLDMVRQKQEAGRSATLTPLYPHGTVDMPENYIFMSLEELWSITA